MYPKNEEHIDKNNDQIDSEKEKPDIKMKSGQAPPWEELGRGTGKIPIGASEVLKKYFDVHQIEMAGEYHSFFTSWKQIAGIDLAAHSTPRDITNETLIVEADHPGWMQMLNLKRAVILKSIHQKFPQLKIKSIRVVLFSGPGHIHQSGITGDQQNKEEESQCSHTESASRQEEGEHVPAPKYQEAGKRQNTAGGAMGSFSDDEEATETSGQKNRLKQALEQLGKEVKKRNKPGS